MPWDSRRLTKPWMCSDSVGPLLGRFSGSEIRMCRVGVRFDWLDWLLALLLLGTFVWMLAVIQDYTHRMPQRPDPKAGRVLPYSVNCGRTVFVSRAEERRMNGTYLAFAAAGGCFYLGVVQRRVWRKRTRAKH